MLKNAVSFNHKNVFIFLFFTFIVFTACSNRLKISHAQDLQQIYLNAVKDAEIAESNEISKNLLAIVEHENRLQWQEHAGQKRVLVLTWTSWHGYDDKIGQTINTTRETWVTVAPELQNFCQLQKLPQKKLILRLEQLLGLPPDNGKTRFVEMWTSPDDLFRPSPDPEITDHEAELDFPKSANFLTISDDYRKWFNVLKNTSYQKDGYPWTRLGYTYDWGNPKNEVGLSEFVIRTGAAIEIKSVSTIDDYCNLTN